MDFQTDVRFAFVVRDANSAALGLAGVTDILATFERPFGRNFARAFVLAYGI